ncbi:MAG: hypothetical protein LBS91_05410 [Clostridiales Family XIII bacterium]|nr:hypothetical protein [Clostridiales Family XIII bacterium]
MKTNKFKTVFGVALVVFAVAALLFWEAEGREMLLMDAVLVADADMKAGEPVAASGFHVVSAPAGTLVDGALGPGDAWELDGKAAAADIVKGAQLSRRYLRDKDAAPKPETSCFVIRNEWISMCTSALRRGDEALIVSADGTNVIGCFPVAYVKDGDGREVTDASSGMYGFTGAGTGNEHVNTSSPIHHVEIECELKEYRRILDFCAGKAYAPLMLVRKEAQ